MKKIICKHCKHPLKKRYFVSRGQSMWEWTHKQGGNYCNVGGASDYTSCLCHSAEPFKE